MHVKIQRIHLFCFHFFRCCCYISLVWGLIRSCACQMCMVWTGLTPQRQCREQEVIRILCDVASFVLYGKSNKMMLWTEGEIVAIILWPNKQFNYNNTASKQKLYSILFFELAWTMSSSRWRQRWWWRWRCDAKTKDQVNMKTMPLFLRIR